MLNTLPVSLLVVFHLSVSWATARPHLPEAFTSHYHSVASLKTEPKFTPEQFNIIKVVKNRSLLSPGYFFIDPLWQQHGFGPQIYDSDGTLIWHGEHRNRSQNLHVCDFAGQLGSHLCTSNRAGDGPLPESLPLGKGVQSLEWNFPINEVMDNTYKSVARYTEGFDGLPMNIHAFHMFKGGHSFGTIVYKPTFMDLRPYGGPEAGLVKNECIDDIDTRTKKSLFHWCYLESGLKIWETQVFPFHPDKSSTNITFPKAGTGSRTSPWDFLHINAMDKNSEGDYYISVRFLDQIIKVAGISNPDASPGTILWRLGGHGNNFSFTGFYADPPFSRPHDVRALSISPDGSEETITLFNNAWDGASGASQRFSEGQVIRINTKTQKAHLAASYPHPRFGHIRTGGRGSVQILPNHNVMMGWGTLPHLTEFDSNGTVLYHATFARLAQTNPEFSYRAVKFPWVGKPYWPPKLVPYSQTCGTSSITAYVSWNGATEVRHWRFYTAKDPRGPWRYAGTYSKQDYETKVTLHHSIFQGFISQVYVGGLDSQGNLLGSTTSATFVPKIKNQSKCDADGCEDGFRYTDKHSRAQMCYRQDIFPYLLLALLIIFTEGVVGLSQQISFLTNAKKQNYFSPEKQANSLIQGDGDP